MKNWQMLRCPSAPSSGWGGVNGPAKEQTNYMINGVVGRWPVSPSLAQITAPAEIIYLQESYYYGPFSIARPLFGYAGATKGYQYWHYGYPNNGYCNGLSSGPVRGLAGFGALARAALLLASLSSTLQSGRKEQGPAIIPGLGL